MKKIKGVLVSNGEIKEYELEVNSYKDYYKILDCDTFDIVTRKFGDEWLDIYCDDEGLLKSGNKPSILTFCDGNVVEQIVGNAFITSHNDDGDAISLNDEQIKKVMDTVTVIIYKMKKQKVLQATI